MNNKTASELRTPVLAARFIQPWRADLALSLLRSEGVAGYLADDHLARTEPVSSILAGGIRLLVERKDLSRAREILNRAEQGDLALPAWEGDPHSKPMRERVSAPGEVRCQRCGSSYLEAKKGIRRF
ncbi:DUF2007 domain-containing protein, partial [bacterium]